MNADWTACGRGIFDGDIHIATTTHPRDVEEAPDCKFPTYDQSIANARLMAAAPDLLAALKVMVDTPTGEGEDMRAIQEARAAIAKAEGAQ